jgi:hypothetical protein
MGGGMAASAASIVVLRIGQSPEAFSFAGVAAAAGLVLTLWAYVAVQLSDKATARDRLNSHIVTVLALGIPVANLALNRDSWGVYFLTVELIILLVVAALAVAVAFVVKALILWRRELTPIRLRGYTLLTLAVVALIFWLPVRWPILALYHTGCFGDRASYWFGERLTASSSLKAMPQCVVRWAANLSLDRPSSRSRHALYERLGYLPRLWNYLEPRILAELCLDQSLRAPELRRTSLETLAQKDRVLAKQTALDVARRFLADSYSDWIIEASPDLLVEDCTPELFKALMERCELIARCTLLHAAYKKRRGDLLVRVAREFRAEHRICFGQMPPSDNFYNDDDLAALILEHHDANVRAGLFDFWPDTLFSYDPQWQNVPPAKRKLFCRALNDPDISVQAAAARRFIACVLNKDALPVKLEDLKDDASIRRAAEALLPALQELKPKP